MNENVVFQNQFEFNIQNYIELLEKQIVWVYRVYIRA